jgi:putative spermidine/putrescine transport system substrate-binding protein
VRYQQMELLEPLDLSYIPLEAFPETSFNTEVFVDLGAGSTLLIWNTEAFPTSGPQPDTVLDIFDTETFPGKRCLFSFLEDGGQLEYALLAEGVTMDEMYDVLATEEGVQQALDRLETIRGDIVYVESGAESIQFVLDRQCDLGISWSGRIAARKLEEPDLPLAATHQDELVWGSPYFMPKGVQNYDAALSNLAYGAQPRNQCDLINTIAYGVVMNAPPFPDCLGEIAREFSPHPEVAAGGQDPVFYLEHGARLNEAWTAWKAAE